MNEAEILEGLHSLGIGAANHRLVLLLPLVQVAWADDAVQAGERRAILDVAQRAGLVDSEAFATVESWLTTRPSAEELALGRRLLVALAHRQVGLGAEVGPADLTRVQRLSEEVARSAGGLFGLAFSVSAEERSALAEIEASVQEASEAFLDLLPTSSTGTLEDL